MPAELHSSHLSDIDPVTLYRILQLRTDVFVVEQACAYPELDGRDLEPDSLMVWATKADRVIATLRILRDASVSDEAKTSTAVLRIGRVTTHPEFRGTPLARELFAHALSLCTTIDGELPIVLDAQEPLESWYAQFDFVRTGDTFLDDGIAHVPMRRAPHTLRSRLSDLNR
jgi:ElaA protein